MLINTPKLYVNYFENLEPHKLGPFFTVSPDGCGASIGQDWCALSVQLPSTEFVRISVPTRHYSITSA